MRNTSKTQTTDEDLVDAYKAGNNECLGTLYARYYKKVYHKCLSHTKNPDVAFDLAQDILLKAFGKINTFLGNSSFSTWLYVVTNNHCIAFLRKSKNIYFENIDLCFNMEDEISDIEERLQFEKREQYLATHLGEISEIERKMLILKYQNNYSIFDLQQEFNMNASAVKMRLHRAKHKMEQKLSKIPDCSELI
jgi:RNA polymerase sigma factor (sigma-70 family)